MIGACLPNLNLLKWSLLDAWPSCDVCYWHLSDQITAQTRRPLSEAKQTWAYADSARYTDAFDKRVCRMISGSVLPAVL